MHLCGGCFFYFKELNKMNPKQRQAFGRMFAASKAAGNDNNRSVVMALKVAEKIKQSARKHFDPILYLGLKDIIPLHEGNCGMDDIGMFHGGMNTTFGFNTKLSPKYRENIVSHTGSDINEVSHVTFSMFGVTPSKGEGFENNKNLDAIFKFIKKHEANYSDRFDINICGPDSHYVKIEDTMDLENHLNQFKETLMHEISPDKSSWRTHYKKHDNGINIIKFDGETYHKFKNAKLVSVACMQQSIIKAIFFVVLGFEVRNENYTTSRYN